MTLHLRAVRAGAIELRPWAAEPGDRWEALSSELTASLATEPTTLRWEASHPAEGLAPLVLCDQTPYLLALAPGHALAPGFEAPRITVDGAGRSLHALTLRGHAGRVRLRAGETSLDAEVCLRRDGATADWRAMRDALCAADLALAARAGAVSEAALGIDPAGRARTPVEQLLLLRHLVASGALRGALDAIARDPLCAVAPRVSLVPLDRASRAHPEELAARAARGHSIAREAGPALSRDVSENRFVAACLDDFAAIARGLAAGSSPLTDRALRRLADDTAAALGALVDEARRGPLAGVSASPGHRPLTVALQRRAGYREVLAAWQRFHAPPAPRPCLDAESVGLADAPRLYERWCGLALARALGLDDDRAVAFAAGGCVVRVAAPPSDATLASQAAAGSYGRGFRPDFVLRAGGRALVLDAKYQIDEAAGRLPAEALTKMHAYRDAIAGATWAWALFPGSAGERWEAPDGGGVGALPLRPGGGDEAALADLVRAFLLADGRGAGGKNSLR